MAPYIDAWFALLLVIFGLSHAAQPRLWADFFNAMKAMGYAPLIIGMYTLPTGLLILVAHNQWAWGWPLIVTVAGWGMTIKSTVYLIFPAAPNRMIENADHWQRSFGVFRVAGLVMGAIGVPLAWQAFHQIAA